MKVSRFITTISLTTFLSICSVHSSSIHFFSIRGAEAQATVTVRNDYVWIDMPQTGNQNDNWSCGPTSAARVINFYGHNVNRDTLVGAVDREFILPSRIEKPWGGHVDIRTGTTPHVLRDVMKRWEGNNVKLERKADFNRLLGLLRQGKPVVVLLRVGSLRPLGPISGTWPEMHWVTVHGFSESEQKIYYTETNGETYSYSYNEFQSKWNWRVGDGLANESIRANGVEQRTMIWVDRVSDVVADANFAQSSQPIRYEPGFYSRIGMKPPGIIYLWPSPWDGGKTDVWCDVPNHAMFARHQGDVPLYQVEALETVQQNAAYWSKPCTDGVFEHSTVQSNTVPSVGLIKTPINHRVLDFRNSERNREPVILVDEHRGTSQQWRLIPLDNGFYLIKSMVNGRVLDFRNSERNKEPIILVDEHRGTSQQWKLEKLPSGKFMIVSKVNGRVLDFTNSERNKEPLILVDRHGGDSQQWIIEGL